MTSDERKALIDIIRKLPARVEAAAGTLSEQHLDTPTAEHKWTTRQIVHHIADAHMNAVMRMKLIVTENKPLLKPYNQDAWALLEDTTKGSLRASLDIIRGLHERWAQFLEALPEEAWIRTGIHLENGKVILEDLLKVYARHSENHLQQILNYKQRNGIL
ncbi:MAG: DinB family protein [Bacteroidota bacterium]